jgi:hypothetical protein
MYAGGSSLALVGFSDFKPQSGAAQAFYLFNSLVGMSVFSLTLTYVMQIYSALHSRNAFGLKIRLLSANTDDAAELLAGLGPQGRFDSGFTILSNLAAEAATIKEYHHFYPVLFYFRFREPFYSVSQSTFVLLDAVSLLKSALDDKEYGWLKESASVVQCWQASTLLIEMLEQVFLSGRRPPDDMPPDGTTREHFRLRYFAAIDRLREAGIQTIADPNGGAGIYTALRERWSPRLARLAKPMLYDPGEINQTILNPTLVRARPPFQRRLHDTS